MVPASSKKTVDFQTRNHKFLLYVFSLRAKNVCIPMYNPLTLKVQNIISEICSLFSTIFWRIQRRLCRNKHCFLCVTSYVIKYASMPKFLHQISISDNSSFYGIYSSQCLAYYSIVKSRVCKFLLSWSKQSQCFVSIFSNQSRDAKRRLSIFSIPHFGLSFTIIHDDIIMKFINIFNNQYCIEMSKSNKVSFKVILTSEIQQPFKVVSVPEQAPFSAVIRYVCDEFKVDEKTTSTLTMDGVGINPDQSCGDVFLKFGSDLKMIPRDRVGHFDY